jgi:hypothetical protein
MKYHMTVGIILLLLIVNLSGCINNSSNITSEKNNNNKPLSETDKFIGRWESEDGVIFIFKENNECSMEGFFQGSGKWELKNNTLYVTLEYKDGQNYMAFDYAFSEDNTILTLTDPGGRARSYNKQ